MGTPALSWRDLWVICRNLPRTSASARAIYGDKAEWGAIEHLLAALVDAVNIGNWQRQGKKNAPKPKPIPRPGKEAGQKIGRDPIPVSQFDDWWNSRG